MRTDALDYRLPEALIATEPASPRDSARLLVVDRRSGKVFHHVVKDLPRLAQRYPAVGLPKAGDVLIVNQTRVLPAYFSAQREETGGKITGLFLGHGTRESGRGSDEDWEVLLESGGKLRQGERVCFGDAGGLLLIEKMGGGRWFGKLQSAHRTVDFLSLVGRPPLPPYIRKQRQHRGVEEFGGGDVETYNTVYAGGLEMAGSVAAPTAGLHFTDELLGELREAGIGLGKVRLDVGLGTFSPIRSEFLSDHQLHSEKIFVPRQTLDLLKQTRAAGGHLIAVGTTSVRTLESLPDDALRADVDFVGETNLFVKPNDGFVFRFTDSLLTNFHLPKSSLIALVASLPGLSVEQILDYYAIAIAEGYRFYSYGDAMLIV